MGRDKRIGSYRYPDEAAADVVELLQCTTCAYSDGMCPDYVPDLSNAMWCENYSEADRDELRDELKAYGVRM